MIKSCQVCMRCRSGCQLVAAIPSARLLTSAPALLPCCLPQVKEEDLLETIDLLTAWREARHDAAPQPADPGEWKERLSRIRASLESGGQCDRCSAAVRVLCVTPCACLLCVDCTSLDRTRCPKCETPYKMQVRGWTHAGLAAPLARDGSACAVPGHLLHWVVTPPSKVWVPGSGCCWLAVVWDGVSDERNGALTHKQGAVQVADLEHVSVPVSLGLLCLLACLQETNDPGRLRDNPNPQWAVPEELIEFQPAYTQQGVQRRCAAGFTTYAACVSPSPVWGFARLPAAAPAPVLLWATVGG